MLSLTLIVLVNAGYQDGIGGGYKPWLLISNFCIILNALMGLHRIYLVKSIYVVQICSC